MKRLLLCLTLMAAPLGFATVVHAEGSAEEDAPKPVVKKKRLKPKAKPAPAPVMPAAPIPYNAYGSAPALSPEMNAALTPPAPSPAVITPKDLPQPPETNIQTHAPLQPLPPPVAVTPAPLTVQPMTAPPPQPPVPPPVTAPLPSLTSQISLKCETQVTRGTRFVSQGTFYIDLFPSPVFPDEHADFKFLFVDPAHQSLIRESICLDTGCPANVTGSAYYLVNRVTKRGSALRITLDRTNGAFYAEEIENNRVSRDMHRGEKGYCVPQKLPNALF